MVLRFFRNESEVLLEKIGPLLSATMCSKTDSCRITKQEDVVLEWKTILDFRECFEGRIFQYSLSREIQIDSLFFFLLYDVLTKDIFVREEQLRQGYLIFYSQLVVDKTTESCSPDDKRPDVRSSPSSLT